MILTEAAPAKVNLALHVRRRRADGYHDLETIFAFTGFGDALTAAPASALSLTAEGEFATLLGDGDNLILRAARALASAAGIEAGAVLHLVKRIPVAAGLGGGSADAAAALRLLSRLWQLDWPLDRLAQIGATLGADVPACVHGCTQLGLGSGTELIGWPGAPVTGVEVLLVNPRVAVPTGPVFAGWDRVDRGALDASAPMAAWRNDLTDPAVALQPVIADVLAELTATRAALVRMSGSGATCLALYPDGGAAFAARDVAVRHPGWWIQATALQ